MKNVPVQDNSHIKYDIVGTHMANYFQKKEGIIYINVMNNMSIDCDCVDIINQQKVTATNGPTDPLSRIDQQHGTHTIDWAEKIGLGSRKYHIVNIDK